MRQQFIEAETEAEAKEQCPWASAVREVEGGYYCFESYSDAETFDRNEARKTIAETAREAGLVIDGDIDAETLASACYGIDECRDCYRLRLDPSGMAFVRAVLEEQA